MRPSEMLSRFSWFTNYGNKRLEWLLAIYTLYFGVMVILPAQSMNPATFTVALNIAPEWVWGAVYAIVGIIHNLALHINGRAAWTPFARLFALFLNSQVFLAMALSLFPANPMGTGVLTYIFVAVGFCGAAFYAAALDCGREIKIWRAAHGRI